MKPYSPPWKSPPQSMNLIWTNFIMRKCTSPIYYASGVISNSAGPRVPSLVGDAPAILTVIGYKRNKNKTYKKWNM